MKYWQSTCMWKGLQYPPKLVPTKQAGFPPQHGGVRLSEDQGPEQSTSYALIFEGTLKVDMTF